MGIPIWRAHRSIDGERKTEKPIASLNQEEKPFIAGHDWDALFETVSVCQACDLHKARKNIVFGVGDKTAQLMVIGESPGIDEEANGEPFLGDAGRLLNRMLFSIGLARNTVYMTNTIKCHVPDGQKLQVEFIAPCADYLTQQIMLLNPQVILAVGAVSAQHLLNCKQKISELRENSHIHPEFDIPVIATYHPGYLRRSPSAKLKVWQDLLRVKSLLEKQTSA